MMNGFIDLNLTNGSKITIGISHIVYICDDVENGSSVIKLDIDNTICGIKESTEEISKLIRKSLSN